MIAREALAKIREWHRDSGQRAMHWCQHYGGSFEPEHGPGPNSCEECGSEMYWPCPTRQLVDQVSADEGLIEDIATLRDVETDPLRRYRYNVAIAVLSEIAGEDLDIASQNRTAVLDSYLQTNLHEQDDEHGLMSPPIDGEDAMFWTPECYCGAPWPCPYVRPTTERPDERA